MEIVVRIHAVANVPPAVLANAERDMSSIYDEAGIKLRFINIEPEPSEWAKYSNPLRSVQVETNRCDLNLVDVQLSDRFPRQFHHSALGFALPFATTGLRVTMFYDRLNSVSRNTGVKIERVLTVALAHELAHVIARTEYHSEDGVLRSMWEARDFAGLDGELQRFSRDELDLLNHAIGDMAKETSGCRKPPVNETAM